MTIERAYHSVRHSLFLPLSINILTSCLWSAHFEGCVNHCTSLVSLYFVDDFQYIYMIVGNSNNDHVGYITCNRSSKKQLYFFSGFNPGPVYHLRVVEQKLSFVFKNELKLSL